jgi:hypothetical protein
VAEILKKERKLFVKGSLDMRGSFSIALSELWSNEVLHAMRAVSLAPWLSDVESEWPLLRF